MIAAVFKRLYIIRNPHEVHVSHTFTERVYNCGQEPTLAFQQLVSYPWMNILTCASFLKKKEKETVPSLFVLLRIETHYQIRNENANEALPEFGRENRACVYIGTFPRGIFTIYHETGHRTDRYLIDCEIRSVALRYVY